jgi:hypothetical protein
MIFHHAGESSEQKVSKGVGGVYDLLGYDASVVYVRVTLGKEKI